jgi:hypothetical protein
LITLAYAGWWALGGWLFGIGVNAVFNFNAATVCALGNVIVGLLLLLPVVADNRRRRLFFDGPRSDEPSDPHIGLLWVFPFVGVFVGLFWWLLSRFT